MTCKTCDGEGVVMTGLPYDGNGKIDACPDCAWRAELDWIDAQDGHRARRLNEQANVVAIAAEGRRRVSA